MTRFLPVAMTALTALVSQPHALGIDGNRRHLATYPAGFFQMGQTLSNSYNVNGTAVEFGTSVVIADTGRRLLVGARGHDFDDLGLTVEDAGAFFVYDLADPLGPSPTWEFKASFIGIPDEELGRSSALSSDGSIIAIRRGNFGAVEVWQVNANGVKTRRGQDLLCNGDGPEGGAQVALSPSGQRLAMSCEYEGQFNAGSVKIFDWDGTAWVPNGILFVNPSTTTAKGLFGFDTSFSGSGNRLAISSPSHNAGIIDQGLVRVFDYVGGSTWSQVGQDLLGSSLNQKFGFSMDMSSDGNTLVVGSPNKYLIGANANGVGGTATGAVEVFTLTLGQWDRKFEFVGDGTDDRFGRGISVTQDGRQFVAGSFKFQENRGHIVMFKMFGEVWLPDSEFVGSSAGDQLAFGNTDVSMTDDGSLLAASSVFANVNGIVQVFGALATPSPSQAPTPSPSQAPAASPPPLAPTNNPTSSSSAVNNADPEQFQWDIVRLGSAQVAFTEEADTSEIILDYNISLRAYKVRVYQEDCLTPVPTNVTSTTPILTDTTTTHGKLSVSVDLKQDAIRDSDIWNDTSVGEGLISMCIRVDLLLGDPAETSVTFHEQKVFVTINLLQGFQVTGIDLDRIDASEEDGQGDFDYEVVACQCNETLACVDIVLTQGSDVYICVETTAENVEIEEVRSLIFTQGTFGVNPVVGGEADALSELFYNGKQARIRYQMISAFFENEEPGDVIASGVVLLKFTNDDGRRELRPAKLLSPRSLQEIPDGKFNVTVMVEAAEGFASAAVRGFLVSGAALVLGALAIV